MSFTPSQNEKAAFKGVFLPQNLVISGGAGNDTFIFGGGTLTVQNGKNKKITVIDSSNKTTIYSKTLDLFEDNNFISDTPQISDITEKKFSVTQIQPQDYSALAQNTKTFLTFAKK